MVKAAGAWWTPFLKELKKLASAVIKQVIIEVGKLLIKDLPRKARNWWNGKRIAVIGPTAAGKNSLYQRLRNQPVPKEHIQTRGAEKLDSFKISQALPDGRKFEITVKGALNVGGETDERERYWFQACEDADVIFYITDVQRLDDVNQGSDTRIAEDFRWLAANLSRFGRSPAIHVLVNKIDTCSSKYPTSNGIEEHLKPQINKLEQLAKDILGPFFKRVTGITPTSMTQDHIFGTTFVTALKGVYDALHKE